MKRNGCLLYLAALFLASCTPQKRVKDMIIQVTDISAGKTTIYSDDDMDVYAEKVKGKIKYSGKNKSGIPFQISFEKGGLAVSTGSNNNHSERNIGTSILENKTNPFSISGQILCTCTEQENNECTFWICNTIQVSTKTIKDS